MRYFVDIDCACCARKVGQIVRRPDGVVVLLLVARHDNGGKHVTAYTAEQVRELLDKVETEAAAV